MSHLHHNEIPLRTVVLRGMVLLGNGVPLDEADVCGLVNWADMARGSRKELGSAVMEQKFKIFYHENDDGSPYMEIIALSVAEKRQVLYDFMVEAYGDPAMAADDDKLREYYEANFLARKPDECPIAIWCHEPNQVVLLAVNDEQGNARRHLLHIEPSLF